MLIEIDDKKLKKFTENLCQKNLSDRRVHCCAVCPIENAIVQMRPELKEKFETKRREVLRLPIDNKWQKCLQR